jgi:DNA-binding NtrC family response regulator
MRPRILIIDEDPQIAALLELIVKREGANVVVEHNISRGMTLLATEPIDILFTNLQAHGRNDLEVLRIARQRRPDLPVVVVAAVGTVDSTIDAFRLGAVDYLTTPLQPAQVITAFERAMVKSQPVARRDVAACVEGTKIVAASPSMCHLTQLCSSVAVSPLPILMIGETGVGKQSIVRLIHGLSSRRDEPFVTVNCDAIQESQLVEIFFGREETDRESKPPRIGLIEQASGGTLLLRNITGLPRWMQKEFVQAAQAGFFRRSGGSEPITFRARIAASTVYAPADSIKQGVLLHDLYCYLGASALNVPSLRHRREDIRPLVETLTHEVEAQLSPGAARRFSEEALCLLEAYDWPGNIHELSNFIRRLFVFVPDTEITAAHVNEHLTSPPPLRGLNTITVPFVGDLKLIERAIVAEVISRAHGNKSAAARSLGLHRKTLYRIIENNTNGRVRHGDD